jgi:O-antigen/teichoic acid export membrane protein
MTSADSLKKQILKGSVWLGIGGSSEQGLRFIRNLLLARILLPESFGTMAIVLAVNGFFESFSQIGIREAIIQSPVGDERKYLNGAWWISFVRAIVLLLIGVSIAPFLTHFYKHNELEQLLKVSYLNIFFTGMMSAEAYVSLKKMQYLKWVSIVNLGSIIGIGTTIVLSYILKNTWALVIGYITEAGFRCILSYIICPYVPGFKFDKEHLKSLLAFSKGIFGLPILFFIFNKADIFVIGKMRSEYELGLYSMAVALAQIPQLLSSMIIEPILLPVFSTVRDDAKKLSEYIVKITGFLTCGAAPILCGLAFYSGEILELLFGPQYRSVGTVFTMILFSVAFRITNVPIVALYFSIGKPELNRLFSGVRAGVIVVIIVPSVMFLGLIGAALAIVVALVLPTLIQIQQVYKLTGMDRKSYLKQYFIGMIHGVPVLVSGIISTYFFKIVPAVRIGLIAAVTLFVYAVITYQYKEVFTLLIDKKQLSV